MMIICIAPPRTMTASVRIYGWNDTPGLVRTLSAGTALCACPACKQERK